MALDAAVPSRKMPGVLPAMHPILNSSPGQGTAQHRMESGSRDTASATSHQAEATTTPKRPRPSPAHRKTEDSDLLSFQKK